MPGATCYEDLRRVPGKNNGQPFPTYRDACLARGLLSDDQEWHACMQEAAQHAMPITLRELFTIILVYCSPADPPRLWGAFKAHLCEDFMHRLGEQQPSEWSCRQALLAIEHLLSTCAANVATGAHHTLQSFGIPIPNAQPPPAPATTAARPAGVLGDGGTTALQVHEPSAIEQRETNYDPAALAAQASTMERTLTPDQLQVYNTVMQAMARPFGAAAQASRCFFLHAIGGCGKTYLLNLLLRKTRSMGHVALATASTGVAALLLDGGTTAHFTFALSLKPEPGLVSALPRQGTTAQLLRSKCRLIIVDEATGLHRHLVEQLDRTLRDIMPHPDQPFGDMTIVFAGDFGQTLPVVRHGGTAQQLDAVLCNSHEVWPHVRHLQLIQNQRIRAAQQAVQANPDVHTEQQVQMLWEFDAFLKRVRAGSHPQPLQVR